MTTQTISLSWIVEGKIKELKTLSEGDKIELVNGDIMKFVRLKQKNFIGSMNDKQYNVPVGMFSKLVEKATEKVEEIKNEEWKTLKEGEFFYILEQRKSYALLFKFKGISRNKIIGINPINNTEVKIDPALFVGKVN